MEGIQIFFLQSQVDRKTEHLLPGSRAQSLPLSRSQRLHSRCCCSCEGVLIGTGIRAQWRRVVLSSMVLGVAQGRASRSVGGIHAAAACN